MNRKQELIAHLIKEGYAKPSDRSALMRYGVADLEETLKQFASKKLRRKYVKQPRRPAEYAHPFSCEGLGQWD